MEKIPKKTLITFGAPKFTVRQWLLGSSARACNVVDEHVAWGMKSVENAAGLSGRNPMSFNERGAGFWWWKGYVVYHALKEADYGDIICYSDVGRGNSVKLLRLSLDPIIAWMKEHNQPCVPGVQLPWCGTKKNWTKREAFVRKGLDSPTYWNSPPVGSSFTIWIKTDETLKFAENWARECMDRNLISDDPSSCVEPEFDDLISHMCDQALLGLNLFNKPWKLLNYNDPTEPNYDVKNLESWICSMSGNKPHGLWSNIFEVVSMMYLFSERSLLWIYHKIRRIRASI
ncbi:MAG: hypothetical protein ACK56K_15880 [Akkermansiaceae bacterium]|jgi:hypothetical protein